MNVLHFFILSFLYTCSAQAPISKDDCQPVLADECFHNFTLENLLCQNSKSCVFDVENVCSSILERLECARDVIDGDCRKEERSNFDRWINALIAVHTYLCTINPKGFKSLFEMSEEGKSCWNASMFSKCVEEKTRITHIVDMTQVILDITECNWVMIAFTVCNARATEKQCHTKTSDSLVEVFHIFVEQAKCSYYCSNSSAQYGRDFHFLILISVLLFLLINLPIK